MDRFEEMAQNVTSRCETIQGELHFQAKAVLIMDIKEVLRQVAREAYEDAIITVKDCHDAVTIFEVTEAIRKRLEEIDGK